MASRLLVMSPRGPCSFEPPDYCNTITIFDSDFGKRSSITNLIIRAARKRPFCPLVFINFPTNRSINYIVNYIIAKIPVDIFSS